MKKLLNSYGARVLAFLLFLIFGLITVTCGLGFIYDYETGTGSTIGPRNFPRSEMAGAYVHRQAWYVLWNATGRDTYFRTPPGGFDDGLSYVVWDPEGKIIEDTRRAGSTLVYNVFYDDMYEPDGYSAEYYVNLPTTPDTRLYDYVYLYDFLYDGWTAFLPLTLGAGLLTLLLFIFLLASAGRTAEGPRLGGLHRWPLEIYLGFLCVPVIALMWAFFEALNSPFSVHLFYSLAAVGVTGVVMAALAMLGLMTLAARCKVPGWWRNTVTVFCCKWIWRFVLWCWNVFLKLAAWCWKIFKAAALWLWRFIPGSWKWFWGHIGGAVRGVFHGLASLALALPLTWKALGVYALFALLNIIMPFMGGFMMMQLLLLDVAGAFLVMWLAIQLQKLQKAGRELAAGNLDHTVDTNRMLPTLKEHGENLNAVGVGMTRAVNERMKSERFKTELITNVSHDLKTPLTSIVSYVDLLKKENIDNEKAREYIEVLDRQSQRLKKLTTDLVEASKASSGVLAVNFEQVDLREMLHQSAGEYAERFAAAKLDPVVTIPEGEWVVRADGRLLWRVLDNLLSNAVKYAMPGTRVYLTVARREGKTALSVKNISRDALNIPAEDLMGRFVRGDTSRSTDGSGLGLSIAQSLMELMGGKLQLTLDGDLFKAELLF